MVVSDVVGNRFRFFSPQEAREASKTITNWDEDWTAWTTQESRDWIVTVYDKQLRRIGWICEEM